MVSSKRSKDNPLLLPNTANPWEAEAVFHASPLKVQNQYIMPYRAISLEHLHEKKRLKLSTIGICKSGDGIHFKKRRQFITPQKDWEKYGCEDPRMTYLEDKYYIIYTAISDWPPRTDNIKIALAISHDLESISDRYLVTPFNAKAGCMFPEKINGKYSMLLTVHTDNPPAQICLAQFDTLEQIWNKDWWMKWYKNYKDYALGIYYTENDHVEVGASPVRTKDGWVLIFSYIQNYFKDDRIFRIDALLLDLDNPQQLIGQTVDPLLVPEEQYETYGMVPNVIFPSGAYIEEGQFFIYYSACDTTVCRASITLNDLLDELKHNPTVNPKRKKSELLIRFAENPIIAPLKNHPWESKYTFNAGAISIADKIHILYRAMGQDETSVLGYAQSTDGLHLTQRLNQPVYSPREQFEIKHRGGFSGCEDPRLTVIGNNIYMCYTAYDGINPPRIAISTINTNHFLAQCWNWTKPKLISAPGIDNKDSCILADKIHGKYAIFHRIPPCIWIDYVDDLEFGDQYLGGHPLMGPRVNSWDNLKIGLNGPAEKTSEGWLLLYHGVSKEDDQYRMGAALLDLENPLKVTARLHNPIFEPKSWYENEGYRPGTVFSNGQVIKDDILYVYYGASDKYLGVATCPLDAILDALKKGK